MKTFEELKSLVSQWARDRRIVENSTPSAQLLKTVSELGELADATVKNYDTNAVIDGVGDTLVTLIIYCETQGIDIVECLASAYDVIKDRKGYLSESGVFVKEG